MRFATFAAFQTAVLAFYDPKCYTSSSTVYGQRQGTQASDLTALERVQDSLTLGHRIVKVHACVDNVPDITSGKLNGVMLTVGNWEDPSADFNLNTYGLMEGHCDTFIVDQNAHITKLELAYTPTAVTALQLGTDTNRQQLFGYVGQNAQMIRFSFNNDKPWIGFTGFSTTYPKALAPVSSITNCDESLSVFDKHKAMFGDASSNEINTLIDKKFATYAQQQESQGNSIGDYGQSRVPSQVCTAFAPLPMPYDQSITIVWSVLITLLVEVLMIGAGVGVWCWMKRSGKGRVGRTKHEEEERLGGTDNEGGEKAAVIYVYRDKLVPDEENVVKNPKVVPTDGDMSRLNATAAELLTPTPASKYQDPK